MITSYPFPGIFRAKCLRVIDGDTVELLVDLGFHSHKVDRFRLSKIDAPELRGDNKEKGALAKTYLESLILNRPEEWPLKILVEKDHDSFGRWLGELFIWISDDAISKEVSVNKQLVESGHAVWFAGR